MNATPMRIVRSAAELGPAVTAARTAGATIGLVPTMGALHEGHLSLIRRARSECGFVVVSVFVNPTQFGPGEDLARYPRDEARDAGLAGAAGADVLFAPPVEEVYPGGPVATLEVPELATVLCGAQASRGPEHFRGVATVVARLFEMARPDVAYFGQKDFQQTRVVAHMAEDLRLPVRIEVCPTVRDAHGLALSSRNAYLSPAERTRALALKRALDAAEATIHGGASRDAAQAAAEAELEAEEIVPEYVQILRAEDLGIPSWDPGETVVIAVAARIGRARLIDNALVKLPALVSHPAPA